KTRSIKEFEQAGFSPYYYTVLALLDEGACQSQATMAESLRLHRSQLPGLLDELEERGLVDRRRDRTARRPPVLSLPEARRGRRLSLRRLWDRALPVGREVRVGLRLAELLRAGRLGERRDRGGRELLHAPHRGSLRDLPIPPRPRLPRRPTPDRPALLHQLGL